MEGSPDGLQWNRGIPCHHSFLNLLDGNGRGVGESLARS